MAKKKLIENVLVPASKIIKLDVSLTEALMEGTQYKALSVYRFPFTRPGQKNLNGRIYPYKLWDRVFQLFKTKATVSLCNHPEDDGDPARIWAVLRNPGYSGDRTLGLVDCYILDNELGRTANGVLMAGGDLGLSSSGIGDFEVDGVTVDADTYELERFFDWVLNPSYSVFGTLDDHISEAVMTDPTKNNGNDPGKIQEAGVGKKVLSLREKRELEASFKRIYEDVKAIPSVRERLNRAKEALTFYEDTDVESYKGEFEELVKEAEKEFESTLAKGGEVDAVRKEAEETSWMAKEAKREAENLKKENDALKKENAALKAQVEASQKLKDESEGLLNSMAESTRRNIPYEKYEELRQYAVKAAKMYSEMKNDRNILQIQLQEMRIAAKAREEARMAQNQRDAAARAHVVELRQKSAEAKALAEKQLREAQEAEFMRNVNPEVLEYYNDLVRIGENVNGLRMQILSRKTLLEAQMLVLKAKRKEGAMAEAAPIRDLSSPLPVKNYRSILPDIPIEIPKGFI
jgi:Holliday junction resolvase RusA-like endonuclease